MAQNGSMTAGGNPFDPPTSFSPLHPLLYRSSPPTSSSFPFLRALHLKTIVSLSPDLPQKSLQLWCEAQAVRFVHLGNRPIPPLNPLGKSWRPISEELVKDALEFVLEAENQPCLLMDQSGIYETGIVCGCLRKLERWCLSAILAEYASFAGSKSRGSNEQFIEMSSFPRRQSERSSSATTPTSLGEEPRDEEECCGGAPANGRASLEEDGEEKIKQEGGELPKLLGGSCCPPSNEGEEDDITVIPGPSACCAPRREEGSVEVVPAACGGGCCAGIGSGCCSGGIEGAGEKEEEGPVRVRTGGLGVAVCGPGSMIAELRNVLARVPPAKQGRIGGIDLHEERFSL